MSKISRFAIVDDLLISLESGVQEPGDETLFLSDKSLTVRARSALVAGCGAGLLPIRLARRSALETVTAIDLNPRAVSCCRRNTVINNVGDRVTVAVADMRNMAGQCSWDLVLSNPPQLPTLDGGSRDDWVSLANDGGENGREIIDWLCSEGTRLVAGGGVLMFTHFTFLNISQSVDMLRQQDFRVSVSRPFKKPFGVLSGERLSMLSQWTNTDYYSIVIITAKKGGDAHGH